MLANPPAWDLSTLFTDDEAVREAAARLEEDAACFEEANLGRAGADLGAAIAALDSLLARRDEIQGYVYLRVVSGGGRVASDLEAQMTQRLARVTKRLAFIEEAWVSLDDETAERILAEPALAGLQYPLRRERERPRLDEPTEAALLVREPAVRAWGELHHRLLAQLVVRDGDESLSYEQAFAGLDHPEHTVRLRLRAAIAAAVSPHLTALAACLDAVVTDRLDVSDLYGETPLSLAAIEDGVSPETIEALVDELERSSGLIHRLVALKARCLGTETLSSVDLHAPVGELPRFGIEEARVTIVEVIGDAVPELREPLERLFDDKVDLRASAGKGRTEAIGISRNGPAYVLSTFTGSLDDVVVLAHELGHALHFELAFAAQSHLASPPSTPICEVAALLAEQIVLDAIVSDSSAAIVAASPADDRLALELHVLERRLSATVFQGALFRFEQALYEARRRGEPLDAERLTELWSAGRRRLLGPQIAEGPGFAIGWTGVSHILDALFYNYSYAYASFLASELASGLRAGEGSEQLLGLLRAGGAQSTVEILAQAGLTPESNGWRPALDRLERDLAALELAFPDVPSSPESR